MRRGDDRAHAARAQGVLQPVFSRENRPIWVATDTVCRTEILIGRDLLGKDGLGWRGVSPSPAGVNLVYSQRLHCSSVSMRVNGELAPVFLGSFWLFTSVWVAIHNI